MELQNKEKTYEFDPSHFFESFIGIARELIFKPRIFFRQLPREQSLINPFVFVLICSFLSSLFMANLRNGDLLFFSVLFIANTVSTFMGSFVLNIIISKISGTKKAFESTFRILAYAGLMDIVSWIPVVGPIAYFYGIYLIFIGLQEVHQLKSRQVGIAIISIVFIITLLFLFLISMMPEGWNEGLKYLNPENTEFR